MSRAPRVARGWKEQRKKRTRRFEGRPALRGDGRTSSASSRCSKTGAPRCAGMEGRQLSGLLTQAFAPRVAWGWKVGRADDAVLDGVRPRPIERGWKDRIEPINVKDSVRPALRGDGSLACWRRLSTMGCAPRCAGPPPYADVRRRSRDKRNAAGLSFKVFGEMPDRAIVKIDGLGFVMRKTRTKSRR